MTTPSVDPTFKNLASIDTFIDFSNIVGCSYSIIDDEKVMGPGTNRSDVFMNLDFDGIEIWAGAFLMHKFTLNILINNRTRAIMQKDDLNVAWSIIHRCYIHLSTVK